MRDLDQWSEQSLNLPLPSSASLAYSGCWECDGLFDSCDMVTAFADGGYEQGLRTDAVAVPEPERGCCWCWVWLGW